MVDQIRFEIISPKKLEASGAADMVIVPGVEGDMGIQNGRMPVTLMLRPAAVYIMDGNVVEKRIFIDGGYAQLENNTLRILCEESYLMDEIALEDVLKRIKQAEEKEQATQNDLEKAAIDIELKKARALEYAINHPSYTSL